MTLSPVPLATTLAISKINRELHLRIALEYRRVGARREKQLALTVARLERMNARELLGPAPF